MESKVLEDLEDLEEDGRNINLLLKGMVVKTLGPDTRINYARSILPFRYFSQCQVGH
jgi:hypothetical protein